MALPPAFTATTKSPSTDIPLELDELLDELEDELLELEELELLELEELVELEALEELEELELLLELVLPPPQPTNPILVTISASNKIRWFLVDLFIIIKSSLIMRMGSLFAGDIDQKRRFKEHHQGNWS